MDLQGFRNPDSILRPAPFWAINSRIEPEETARQMADMIDVGLSGGFFHSRHGLITDYLSDEWFDSMNAALEVAKAKDGYLWLYDEDLWPSGNAGGQVAAMKDEYRATTLNAFMTAAGEPAPALGEDQAFARCYGIISREGLSLKEFEQIPLDRIAETSALERLYMVRTYTAKIGWWGGESYANLLHPEAMEQFIRMTHDVYLEKLGAEFGKRIPGIFTDEPQIPHASNGIAWYGGIPELYGKWHARDFWADLPFMFFEGSESRRIRLLVHRTILRQFLEAYSRPIFEWCEKHGIEHTGHYNAEDNFPGQIICHSGGIMAHYRYQQAPGIDHLCRQIGGMLFTCKQVASAARQLGRPRVLTEIFGVSRHTNTFEDFKWLGDYDLVLGANFFVPHLTWYSAKGRRKRDYPPVWNYQQTYWEDLNPLNDYFTRIAHALRSGKPVVDILMLHSIESATAARRLGVTMEGRVEDRARKLPVDAPREDMSAAHHLDGQMRRALDAILNAGFECDLGDESYIEDMGSVSGDSFTIGEMSYRVVVAPPATTWRPRTFELMKQFTANGGKVIMLGELPSEIDCIDAREQWVEFASGENVLSIPCSTQEIQDAVDRIAPKTFTLKGTDGRSVPLTYVHHRKDGDQDILFVANSDRNNARDYVLTFPGGAGKAFVEWDAVKGACAEMSGCAVGGDLRYRFSLPPAGSLLVTVGGKVQGAGEVHDRPELRCGPGARVEPLPAEFDFERSMENVLVMDRIGVSLDGGRTFQPEELEWRVRRGLAQHFGTSAALEWQPWVAIRKGLFDGKGGEIVLRYMFLSDVERPRAWVVIEDIEKGELTVNGTPVDTSNAGWLWDRGFGKVEITHLVKKGENQVDFKVNYDFLTEVEAAYIVGDFGVEMIDPFRGKVVEEPMKLRVGSWSDQGYPFYSGRMICKASFDAVEGKRSVLRLIRPSGTLYKVRVNGQDAGSILWRPYELDLTPFTTPGANSLEIEVVSSLQNSWGPLHEKVGDDNQWCGPNAFENDPELREELNTFNYGLLGGAEIVFM